MVALSCYDDETLGAMSCDPLSVDLEFYDVTLVRKGGTGFVGYKILFSISDVLAKFMNENSNVVLCFYCDAYTDVLRSHTDLLPQEYRSQLFSRMFEWYVESHKLYGFINHRVEMIPPDDPDDRQYAHFICRQEHEAVVESIGVMLQRK